MRLFHARIPLKNGPQPIFVSSGNSGEFQSLFVPPCGERENNISPNPLCGYFTPEFPLKMEPNPFLFPPETQVNSKKIVPPCGERENNISPNPLCGYFTPEFPLKMGPNPFLFPPETQVNSKKIVPPCGGGMEIAVKDGFIKVAACTPEIRVADCAYNRAKAAELAREASDAGAKLIVFPELCLTGYTCQDLFWQPRLLYAARDALLTFAEDTSDLDALIFIGLPFEAGRKLYNVAAVLSHGQILALIPKSHLPSYNEFYEGRHFTPGSRRTVSVPLGEREVPFGTDVIFTCPNMPDLAVACEICEDLWVPCPPSIRHAGAGATVIVNLSASDEMAGKDSYRRDLVSGQSARLVCGYVYASAGDGESTTDLVFSGHNIIAENGSVLAESPRFKNGFVSTELDVSRLVSERRRMTTYPPVDDEDYTVITFGLKTEETSLTRRFASRPFVPGGKEDRDRRCDEILTMQAKGLEKRLRHTGCRGAVIGISGGLDSTLALLVTARAFDLCGIPRENIIAVTMPCFGTTDRTYNNACRLTSGIGATLRNIPISEAVRLHFRDIGQSEDVHDVTYENSQARERTQVLMDTANKTGGLVIGTGDLSELALGWATYNGDHMSMYAVNVSVPKTLVRHLVRYFADTCGAGELSATLYDILDTPVSPELLPPEDGVISQKTEDLVGPYELHDFFLYYMLRAGYSPKKIFRIACRAFEGEYEPDVIMRWLRVFIKRFFSQQFKRSCLPDGPKVGSVAVSPRGDLRMPSDACARVWLDELNSISE